MVELEELPPPPTSSVSVYELSFGTVAGFCAGVFIKKGAKAAAFLLGGIFVLLQVGCLWQFLTKMLNSWCSTLFHFPLLKSTGALWRAGLNECSIPRMQLGKRNPRRYIRYSAGW